jgi:hypothetical protein
LETEAPEQRMEPHPQLPALSPALSELVDGVLGWIIAKIEGREGFSALMVSRHADGNRASHYHADSVEQAVDHALADLGGSLAGASAYALAYDARVRSPEGEQPVFLVRVEEAGMAAAHELVLFYQLDDSGESISIRPAKHLQPTGRTFTPTLG